MSGSICNKIFNLLLIVLIFLLIPFETMPNGCKACGVRGVKGSGVSLHTFPINRPDMNRKWCSALGINVESVKPSNRICQKHFKPSDFIENQGCSYRKRLKSNAVPFKLLESNEASSIPSTIPSPEEMNPAFRDEPEILNPRIQKLTRGQMIRQINTLKSKIKLMHMKLRRANLNVAKAKATIADLKEKVNLKPDAISLIENLLPNTSCKLLLKNELENNARKKQAHRYSKDFKRWCLSLWYYSPKAYRFLRKSWILPNPNYLRSWLSNTMVEPGFLEQVFKHIGSLPEEDRDVNMVFDGMAIRKNIVWCPSQNKYLGYCDYGDLLKLGKESTVATEALAFMLVSLKGKFKWPIGYFFTDKIDGRSQAELVRTALKLSSDNNISVKGVTCDGEACNRTTMTALGCKFQCDKYDEIIPYFLHPQTKEKVYYIPDACHMLKLLRNALATYKVFISDEGLIKWEYFEKLEEYQRKISLKLGNKIGTSHINWSKNKMKVKFAAQLFSSSVASALEFLCAQGVPEFQGCEATVSFIRKVDRLFDFLNSCSPLGTGYKKPIRAGDIVNLEEVMKNTIDYLFSLKDADGQYLKHSKRNTCIFGFATAVKSIFAVSKDLLLRKENPYKYILTYKFSQDFIELLFCRIRGRCGFNNNPNVPQFKSVMKMILLKNEISASTLANCISIDPENERIGSIFDFDEKPRKQRKKCVKNTSEEKKFFTPLAEHDYCLVPGKLNESTKASDEKNLEKVEETDDESYSQLFLFDYNEFLIRKNILYYIGGYIVRQLYDHVSCVVCKSALLQPITDHDYAYISESSAFTQFKNNGGLIKPSMSVVKVVTQTELELISETNNFNELSKPNFNLKVKLRVRKICGEDMKIFAETNACATKVDITTNLLHRMQLITKICERYIRIRLLSFGKMYSKDMLQDVSKRHQLTKLVLFNHM